MDVQLAKNKLQERYQKLKLALPIYKSCQVARYPEIKWQSTVYLSDFDPITGNIEKTKTTAECSAAVKALKKMENETMCKVVSERGRLPFCDADDRIVILIDVENMPKFLENLQYFEQRIDIYLFVGMHHPLAGKIFEKERWIGTINKILTPSTRADSTDTCMQVYVGMWLAQNKYDYYLIVTRDHFGSSLVDLIVSDKMDWVPKKAKIITENAHIFSN